MAAMTDFDLDPEEVRRLGRLAADCVAEHRARLTERPVFGKVGPFASTFELPLPESGRSADEIIAFVREHVMPRPMGNSHPRFFGFINASADPLGTVADYMASAMNPNCWGGDHAAVHVENRVVRWLCDLMGLPADAQGILTSGGSMANFIALAAARRAMTPGNVREDGLGDAPRLVVYASDQVHSCVDKAVDLLGIGTRYLRKIPCDEAFRLPMDALAAAVAEDRARGLRPAIVVGTAGTVNTGAVDPLDAIADSARGKRSGSMPTVPTARWRGSRRRWRRSSRGSSTPIPWPPTRTSGCTCRTRPGPRWCVKVIGSRTRSASSPSTSPPIPTAPSRARRGSPSAAPRCRGASRP